MREKQIAIIAAFYLSKYNKEALRNLGFRTDSEAFSIIAKALGIKKNYVKFRRDEFDFIHPWRQGWQRPMDIRIVNAIHALENLNEIELRELVLALLNDKEYRNSAEITKITSLIGEGENDKEQKKFILRGPTGKKAEEFFLNYYSENKFPVDGDITDTRELGVGYDFSIKSALFEYFIEVKGISELSGGILMTSKEWEIANLKGDRYFLVIISDLNNTPKMNFLRNPAKNITPKKSIIKTIQINWIISEGEVSRALKNP